MSEKFEVGEVAIAIGWMSYSAIWNGSEVLVVEGLAVRRSIGFSGKGYCDQCYLVKTVDGHVWAPDPCQLRKKPPHREDHQLVKWSECPWQPSRERA